MPPARHEEKLAAFEDLVAKAEEIAGQARAHAGGGWQKSLARARAVKGLELLCDQMPAAIAAAKGRHAFWCVLKDKDVDGLLQGGWAMQPEEDDG